MNKQRLPDAGELMARWQAEGCPPVNDTLAATYGVSKGTLVQRLQAGLQAQGVGSLAEARLRLTSPLPEVEEDEGLTLAQYARLARMATRALDKRDPVLTHREYDLGSGPALIMWAGCAHLFGRWTNHDLVQRHIEQAQALGARIALLGDDIEGYLPMFKDASAQGDQPGINWQLALFAEWLAALKGSVLAGWAGQHSGKWQRSHGGRNEVKAIYRECGLDYFDGQAYIKLHVGGQVYQVAAAHTFPGSSMYNKTHAHTRAQWTNYPNADAVVQADKHQFSIEHTSRYGQEVLAGNRPTDDVWYIQVGTAKVGPEPYTVWSYERGRFGWPLMVLRGDQHRIDVTDSIEVAEALLKAAGEVG